MLRTFAARRAKSITASFLIVLLCLTLWVVSASRACSQAAKPAARGFQAIRPVSQANPYDDLRWGDASSVSFAGRPGIGATFTFNQATVWPKDLPFRPSEIMEAAQNPGLGVRALHAQGITGKGVNVAIIDQPLHQDHPEFAGKILAYHREGARDDGSMHGPAVTSLLVGGHCGTAPDARVYYAAVPSWLKDAAYYAEALGWIVDENAKLPPSEKIRVVSVSAAPSGAGSPFTENNAAWDEACACAEAAGILVLDCTATPRGIVGPCWYDAAAPEDVKRCTPGFPGDESHGAGGRQVLAPCSGRTVAEEYDKGNCGYQYTGRGGLSWGIPYVAGVLAMGWQLRPELPPRQMCGLLLETAYMRGDGGRIVDPAAFIAAVRTAQTEPAREPTQAPRRNWRERIKIHG